MKRFILLSVVLVCTLVLMVLLNPNTFTVFATIKEEISTITYFNIEEGILQVKAVWKGLGVLHTWYFALAYALWTLNLSCSLLWAISKLYKRCLYRVPVAKTPPPAPKTPYNP